ncbi:Na(+)/H(+) antiporter subunit B [Planomicrobium chinense]|uniref:Na(+)/H(+) antiporter subunit B n=1 Tax=Planococcus glaciei TaxID=459472 RepID=A0A1G7WHQ4_9BACL|nr:MULTISPECIES: Na(+)/H(+) antiporter subunit B [Planococcus]MCP2034028.1 multicomponent Na+:H+ antiporter subunit B [Planomicrobium sp. HSC-17F08]KOF12019.1 monovalent cation/H+ antiporter subunit B [Planococcus glaciei]MBX0314550.1 Na(+)/H(+) antiporter subunit B [Planococcus glaciei]MBZ5200000.1 Na(+)/H(+) antiporter subunit B [Planococcus chinensis]QDY45089.1 Na(+)/H(+) antiporter subunit B [Planococcus glaciei]
MKINDVILKTVSQAGVLIILTFGVYLFLSGHNQPGGGFIGGLVLATAFVLMFLTFDSETVNKAIPFDFKKISALGVLLAFSSSALPMFFGQPFMSQTFGYFDLPIFGKTELATVTLFESGVALTVIGVVVNIITSISEDE